MTSIVEKFLYLGSLRDACNPSLLIQLEITHLINLSLTRIILDSSFEVLHIPLRDSLDENLLEHLPTTIDFLLKCRKNPLGRCLVFCKHGRSRSVASRSTEGDGWMNERMSFLVVMGYLIGQCGYNVCSSYLYLSGLCPGINPNRNYLCQLNEYSSSSSSSSRFKEESSTCLFIDQERK